MDKIILTDWIIEWHRSAELSVRCGGLLDDPGLRPTRHFFTANKAPWFEIHDDLPRID